MNNSADSILMIFVKNPEKGKVKTRLAAGIGEDAALNVYLYLLNYTKNVAESLDVKKQVWYSDKIPQKDFWPSGVFDKKKQKGHDLGERMSCSFREAFQSGYKKVIIIGSDCPDIKKEHLEEAFSLLDQQDVVIGPSKDGGYYLLGMNHFIPELFTGKSWSTEKLINETEKTLYQLGKRYIKLELLNDIDTKKDLYKSGIEF